jgi:hypothetical protein
VDKEMLEGLDKAGFEVYKGIDNGGISRLYYTRGGGYYIDVGASKHIIDGNIKVHKSPEGIKGFEPHGLVLADGKKLDADFVVLATGFDNMRTTVRKVLGDKVADRCKDVWDLDEEGELQAVSIPQLEYICLATYLLIDQTDMATLWTPQLLVHGRQSCVVPNLLQVPSTTDQGY